MAGKRVHFVLPQDLLDRIDAQLPEGVSRGFWVRRALEKALGSTGEGRALAEGGDPGRPPHTNSAQAPASSRASAPSEPQVETASEGECDCGVPDRPAYMGRDKRLHCGLCDGFMEG